MAGLSRKEISRIVEHIQPQGVDVTRTSKGLLLRLPDQETAMIHFTTSDHRAGANLRAQLKRSGVSWPFDGGRDLPESITKAKPYPRTLEKARTALEGAGNPPKLHIREAERIIYADKPNGGGGRAHVVAQQLYALGWRPEPGKKANRQWLRPLELEPDPSWILPVEDVTPEPEPEPVEAPATPPPGREFIDSADSWALDLASMPEGITLAAALQLLHATGLEAEIRVWRRSV